MLFVKITRFFYVAAVGISFVGCSGGKKSPRDFQPMPGMVESEPAVGSYSFADKWLGDQYGKTTAQRKLQYMPDMGDTPTVQAYRSYLDPPDNSVPRTATFYPEEGSALWDDFSNPNPKSKQVEKQGKLAYTRFCQHCHGVDGTGKSSLTNAYPVAAIPKLNRAELAEMPDRYFFEKITKGGAMMPYLGHAVTPKERWQIVSYLRTIQNK